MTPEDEFDRTLAARLAETPTQPTAQLDAEILAAAQREPSRRVRRRRRAVLALAASLLVAIALMPDREAPPPSSSPSRASPDARSVAHALGTMALGLLVSPAYAAPDLPPGWFRSGSQAQDYAMGVSADAAASGGQGAYIRSVAPEPTGFGTLMQNIAADDYRGQRVQLSAQLRAIDTEGSVQMWMRVDLPNGTSAAMDNMYDRPLTGTTDWQPVTIVLDVPDDASGIAFGFFVAGAGTGHADDFKLTVVDDTVPLTGNGGLRQGNRAPRNLDFEVD